MSNVLYAYASGRPNSKPSTDDSKPTPTFAPEIADKNRQIRIDVQNTNTVPGSKNEQPEKIVDPDS